VPACDENKEFVNNWFGHVDGKPTTNEEILPGSLCTAKDFVDLFESQLISRHRI
jgi:2-oxoisovalerate dehydrogenase E1 component